MLLENKNAVIYGAGGSIGGAVAKEFAREGASVFLTGRNREKLEVVAEEITATDGSAEVAEVDALDEGTVDEHAQEVVSRAGSIDVSFNLVTRGDVQTIPLVEMTLEDFTRPITTGITANFITARATARRMIEQGSGVILALDSGSASGSPMMGGTGPADAATDTFLHPQPGNRDRTTGRARAGHLDGGAARDDDEGEARPLHRRPVDGRGGLPGSDRKPEPDADDPTLAAAVRGRGNRGVPGLGPGRCHHRHVRQRHQRDVPKLAMSARIGRLIKSSRLRTDRPGAHHLRAVGAGEELALLSRQVEGRSDHDGRQH